MNRNRYLFPCGTKAFLKLQHGSYNYNNWNKLNNGGQLSVPITTTSLHFELTISYCDMTDELRMEQYSLFAGLARDFGIGDDAT